jgi:hypothetical protein
MKDVRNRHGRKAGRSASLQMPQQEEKKKHPREPFVLRSPLGGASAVAIGLMNIIIVLNFVCAPETGRDDANAFFLTFPRNALRASLPWIVFSFTAVLSYAVLPVVYETVRGIHDEGARFATTLLGLVGYTVQGVWAITLTRTAPVLSAAYQAGDEITRKAILAFGLPQIDPDGWFSFGGPGTWMILISILAYRGGCLPKWHAAAGVVAGICA